MLEDSRELSVICLHSLRNFWFNLYEWLYWGLYVHFNYEITGNLRGNQCHHSYHLKVVPDFSIQLAKSLSYKQKLRQLKENIKKASVQGCISNFWPMILSGTEYGCRLLNISWRHHLKQTPVKTVKRVRSRVSKAFLSEKQINLWKQTA